MLGQMSLQDNIAELIEKTVLIPPALYRVPHGLEQVSRKEQRHICDSIKQVEMAPHIPGAEEELSQGEPSPCYSSAAEC